MAAAVSPRWECCVLDETALDIATEDRVVLFTYTTNHHVTQFRADRIPLQTSP